MIEQLINDYAEREGKTYAPTSIRNFKNQLKKLNGGIEPTEFEFLKNTEAIETLINSYKKRNGEPFSDNTKKSYYITIATILRALGDGKTLKEYTKVIDRYNKSREDTNTTNFLNKSERQNWTTFENLESILTILKDEIERRRLHKRTLIKNRKDFYLIQKYIVAGLYLLTPPKRADYIMKIIYNEDDDDKTQNYLLVENARDKFFIFNNYKTSSNYGSIKEKVNHKLNNLLNFWLKYNRGNHLIYNSEGNPINENALVKLIPKIFEPLDKHITINLLRKIYISHHVDEKDYKTVDELAKKMLHSSTTAYRNYFKIIE